MTDDLREHFEQLIEIIEQNSENIDALGDALGVNLETELDGDKAAFFGFDTKQKSRSDMSREEIAGRLLRENSRNLARIAREAGAPRTKISEGAVKDDRPERKAKLFGLSSSSSSSSEEKTKAEFMGFE